MNAPWFTLLFCAAAVSAQAVDFRKDVLPIFSEHCYECHGTDEAQRKGGLRLDQRDAAVKGGKSDGPAIVAGQPDASALIARIVTQDADEVMPPTKKKHPLNAAQIETLKAWVKEGAPYAKHWSFDPPVKAALTPEEAKTHPVDALVKRRLDQAGLTLSAPAELSTLGRRLYLDVTGLPPSPAEVAAFVDAATKDRKAATEALIDQLMKSEAYGEKWARVWLDVARYSDSNGFEKDLPREQWAWRDWVIQALNQDKPYDQFLIEQIAGDLLPNATQDQIVATGFLRNNMVNEEGAIVAEQFRMEGIFDRMDCIGKAALGLSLQCAQCHSHKFDPISHDEYYGVFAMLNNTFEAQSWVYTPDQEKTVKSIHTRLKDVNARVQKAHGTDLPAWEKSILAADIPWTVMKPTEMLSKSGLNHPTRLLDDSVLTLGHPSTKSDIYIIGQPELNAATGLRLEAFKHDDLPFGGPGFSKLGTWAITELEVHTQAPGGTEWTPQKLKNASADFAEPDHRIEEIWHSVSTDKDRNRSVGPVAYMIDGNDMTGFRADRGLGRRNTESVAVAQFESPLTLPAGTKLRVMLRTNHGGDDNGRSNTMLGRCRVSLTTAPDPQAQPVDYAAVMALRIAPEKRTDAQKDAIVTAWRDTVPGLKTFKDEADKLWKGYPEAKTSVLRLAERRDDLVRPTFLLDRGIWDQPKREVKPHVPASLHPLANSNPDRLAFARWLTDRQSALTARVEVNRMWQTLFGMGIVETAEDFGTRAAEPEHLAVLDWLAVDFMDGKWSQKQLLRTILTSATYQQSSDATPAQLEKDPRNRLLARGPRFRADAETIRDIALASSGLLTNQVGGPSVFPPVPESVLEYNYVKPAYWKPPVDAQRYRRSMYMFRKRSMPDPVLSVFDAPNGDFSCARRPRSNTPLAALTSLNETVFVEAAQAMALRILKEGGDTDAARVDYAYRLCVSRPAQPAEREVILAQLAEHTARLKAGELKANEIAFSEMTKPSAIPATATPNDVAAWTLISRVLLNLDETLTKS